MAIQLDLGVIVEYAHNGISKKDLEIFKQMDLLCVKPKSATFTS